MRQLSKVVSPPIKDLPLSVLPERTARPRLVNPPPTSHVDLTGKDLGLPLLGKRPRTTEPGPVYFVDPVVMTRPSLRADQRGSMTWKQAGWIRPPQEAHRLDPSELENPPTPKMAESPLLESDEPDSPPPEKLRRLDAFHEVPHPSSTSHPLRCDEDLSQEDDREMGSYYCEACFCVPCLCYEQDETSFDPYE